jgi:hypothetical protein
LSPYADEISVITPVIVIASREGEDYFTLGPISSSTKNTITVPPVQTPSPPGSPTIHIQMADDNLPRNRMGIVVVARYAPLILPQPMNPLLVGDYLKYMPKFTGEEDITIEEHLSSFYNYANNIDIENEYVWLRGFV